jgi:hypothetical protein
LISYGIPSIELIDLTLKKCRDLLTAINTADEVTAAFQRIVEHINSKPLDGVTVERLNQTTPIIFDSNMGDNGRFGLHLDVI